MAPRHPVTTRPLEGGWPWLVRPNPLMLRHDVEPLVMSVWDRFIARLVLLLGRAPQFLYLPSDFRRDSPRPPAFFPRNWGPSCFPAKLLPTASCPRPPRYPSLGATVAARRCDGVGPMGPDPHGTNQPPPSYQQASNEPATR